MRRRWSTRKAQGGFFWWFENEKGFEGVGMEGKELVGNGSSVGCVLREHEAQILS